MERIFKGRHERVEEEEGRGGRGCQPLGALSRERV